MEKTERTIHTPKNPKGRDCYNRNVKSFFIGLLAAITALFGAHHHEVSSAVQTAAVVTAAPLMVAQRSTTPTLPPAQSPQRSAVNSVRKIAENPTSGYVTQSLLLIQLQALEAQIQKLSTILPSTSPVSQSIAAGGNTANPYAGLSRITNLTNVTVSGVQGLKASDIPDLSSIYLTVTAAGNAASGLFSTLSATSSATFASTTLTGNTLLTQATTTNLYATAATVDVLTSGNSTTTNFFATNANVSVLSVGSLSLTNALSVANGGTGLGSITSGSILFGNGASAVATSSNLYWDNTNSRLGIGTSTPSSAIALNGTLSIGSSTLNSAFTKLTTTHNAEQMFINGAGGLNTLGVENTSNSGFSALIARDNNDHERAAFGYGNTSNGYPFGGATYIEGSNDVENQSAASGFNPIRIVQSGGNGSAWVHDVRMDFATDTATIAIPRLFNTCGTTAAAFDFNSNTNTFGIGSGKTDGSGYVYSSPPWALTIDGCAARSGEMRIRAADTSGNSTRAELELVGSRADGADPFDGRIGLARWYINGTNTTGNILGEVAFGGSVSASGTYSDPYYAASITGEADSSHSSSSVMPTDIWIRTGSSGNQLSTVAADGTKRLGVYYNGDVVIGYTIDQSVALAVNGTGKFGTVNSTNGYQIGGTNAVTFPANDTSSSVALGQANLSNITTTGRNDVAAGLLAGNSLTTGSNDVYIGVSAGQQNQTNSASVAVGRGALQYFKADGNVAFGDLALNGVNNSSTGGADSGFGAEALVGDTTGGNNTAVGWHAGHALTTGGQNIFIGNSTGAAVVGGSGNILIGSSVNTPAANDVSNTLNIGNIIYGTSINSSGSIGIGTTSPTTALQVNGVVAPNADNTSSLGNATYRWASVFAANGTIQTSDARLKSNVANLNYGLSDLLKLRPVTFTWTAQPQQGTQLGFIAQEVQPIFPETVNVGDDAHHTLGLSYTEFIPVIVKSIQQLSIQIGDFALNIVSAHVTATNLDADNITIHDRLCAQKSDGTQVCVSSDQLAAVLSQAGTTNSRQGSGSGDSTSSEQSTPPVLQINGDNPVIIHVGDNYADLGATIIAPKADLNLDVKTFLNGTLKSNVVLDTSSEATDTIDYVATDGTGLTATSTRTVIIVPAANPTSTQQ